MDASLQTHVTRALRKALAGDGASRLLGRPSGLFPGGNTKTRAVRFCLDSEPPLLQRDGAKKSPLLVRLTTGGIRHLIEATQPAERANLIADASPAHRLPLLKNWADLAAKLNWREDFASIQSCCGTLIDEIRQILPKSENSEPLSNDEANFKRDLAHELVISWKYAKTPDAREGIARALRVSGVQQIGEPGDRVEFVGRRHICSEALFPGDDVEVVSPGWVVHDGVGEYLLEKATVRAI